MVSLSFEQQNDFAQRVDEAALNALSIPMLTAEFPEMSLDDAYLIQRQSIQRRLERGEKLIGMKMGLTSLAKMQQMGVHSPIYGHLTDAMMMTNGDTLSMSSHCHPRVEPEVCFILKRDLIGPITPAQALLGVEGVCAALEVIDSRYADFKFTLPDVVADNASSSKFVLGDTICRCDSFDISNLGMVVEVDGEVKAIGSSAAIYEHPARSLAKLVNMLAEVDEHLHAGQIILAGGATAALHVKAGEHIKLSVDGLGVVELFVR